MCDLHNSTSNRFQSRMGKASHGSMLDYLKVNLLYECEGAEEMLAKLRRRTRKNETDEEPPVEEPVVQAQLQPQLMQPQPVQLPIKAPTPGTPYQLMGDQVYAGDNNSKPSVVGPAGVDPNQRMVEETDEEGPDEDDFGPINTDSGSREPIRHQRRKKHRRRRSTHFRRLRKGRTRSQGRR